MGLLQNISLRFAEPYNSVGYTSEMRTSQLSRMLNKYAGEGEMSVYYGVPIGNVHPTAWFLPIKVGGMASLSGSLGLGNFTSFIAGGIGIGTIHIQGQGQIDITNISAIANIQSLDKINGLGGFGSNPIIIGGINAVCNIYGLGEFSNADLWDGISIADMVALLQGTTSTSFDIYSAIGVSSSIDGSGNLVADIEAILQRNLIASIQNSSTLTADIQAIADMVIEINSTASMEGDFTAKANISADITPFTDLSPEGLASAVWNSLATQFNNAGTMGNAVNSAGSAGDPWITTLPGTYTDQQAGAMLDKILRISKYLQVN